MTVKLSTLAHRYKTFTATALEGAAMTADHAYSVAADIRRMADALAVYEEAMEFKARNFKTWMPPVPEGETFSVDKVVNGE